MIIRSLGLVAGILIALLVHSGFSSAETINENLGTEKGGMCPKLTLNSQLIHSGHFLNEKEVHLNDHEWSLKLETKTYDHAEDVTPSMAFVGVVSNGACQYIYHNGKSRHVLNLTKKD